ncbi:MAG: hypothetical protein KAJ18_03765 [Candidatus Omnitrophica bacterium]|nr:hypothetical protein [Candidatus Omnitrophota bacterium]
MEDIQHTATGQQQIDGSRPIAIPIVSPDSSFYFQEETAIQKPAFSNAIKKGNRDIIHPVLWDTADKQPLKSPTPLIPGIDLTIPSYKPLGLHSK